MIVLFTLYCLAMTGLFVYGLNCYFLVANYRRGRSERVHAARRVRDEHRRLVPDEDLPAVTVQLPLYNERFVAARVIRQVARLDYPRDRLEIQILDDSTDETTAIVERVLAGLPARLDVRHIRRARRTGYKAGALATGLETLASRARVLAAPRTGARPPEPGSARDRNRATRPELHRRVRSPTRAGRTIAVAGECGPRACRRGRSRLQGHP